jgi:hypothetical protein
MDDYERRYAAGEGRVYFRDKIPMPRWLLPLFVLAPVGIFGMLTAVASFPVLTAGAIALGMGAVGVIGNVALMGLRIVVSDGGIDVHVGIRKHHISLSDVASTRVADYDVRDYPLGRGHLKWGSKGKAFVGGLTKLRGVEITLKNGKTRLITTNDPSGLEQAVHAAMRAPVTPKARVDASVEPRAEELAADVAAGATEPAAKSAARTD